MWKHKLAGHMATIRRYRTAVFRSRSPTDTSASHTVARWVILPNPFGSSRIRISLWGDLRGANQKEGSGRTGTVDGSTNGGFYHQKHGRIHKLRLKWIQNLDLSLKNWEWDMLICCSRDSPKKELWNDFAICTLLSHGTLQNSGAIYNHSR